MAPGFEMISMAFDGPANKFNFTSFNFLDEGWAGFIYLSDSLSAILADWTLIQGNTCWITFAIDILLSWHKTFNMMTI